MQGEKHFFLLPPTNSWCLKGSVYFRRWKTLTHSLPERLYPHATYRRSSLDNALELVPSASDVHPVRWSSIVDPEEPEALPEDVLPIRVTLRAGESLYLPVGWWHYVRQSGLTFALNWWYDAEMRGMSWVMLNFLRNVEEIPLGNEETLPESDFEE